MFLALLEILWSLQPAPSAGAPAAGAKGPAAASPDGCLFNMGLLAVMMVVFYFLLLRPQQKRQKELDAMLKGLRKGDDVRTTGGIRGEVVDLDDQEVTLQIADKVRIRILRSHIAGPAQSASPTAPSTTTTT